MPFLVWPSASPILIHSWVSALCSHLVGTLEAVCNFCSWMQLLFEGVCLTTVILAPGARKGGCELRAKSHFVQIRGIRGDPTGSADEFREAFFCRQASKMRAIGPELEAHLLTKTWNMPLGSPKSPQGPQLHPKGTQMEPKGSKMDPKVDKVGPKVYFSGLLGKKKGPCQG